jgi:hypothetical protein
MKGPLVEGSVFHHLSEPYSDVTEKQLRDHYHHAERAVRGAAQPDAGGIKARGTASLARGGAGGPAAPKGSAGTLPRRGDGMLARQPTGRERQEQRREPD